jgi:hypothetical protein
MISELGYFGDLRRQKSGTFLLERLIEASQGGIKVRKIGGNRSNETRIVRFLHNLSVTPEEMIETAQAHTASLVAGHHILAIQDTTSLRDNGHGTSHYLHTMIAVDADNAALLGPVAASFLWRQGKLTVHCNKRAFATKESARWLEATREAAKLKAAGARRVSVVADREGDIYDEFALHPPETDLLIRCLHNRVLADGTKLFDCTQGLAELGRVSVHVPPGPGRKERDATVALSARPVTLHRPKRNRAAEAAKLPASLTLTYLEARECDAPPRVKPLHWRLLTTHGVATLADACQIVQWYRLRWIIEQVFRVLKTRGFDIEALDMDAPLAFETMVTATLIAAVQVQQMVQDRDGLAKRPLEDAFDVRDQPALEAISASLEGRTERQKNPHPPGSLAHAAWVCARLGGWNCYYRKPGPIVMFEGLVRLTAMLEGYRIAQGEISGEPQRSLPRYDWLGWQEGG